MTAGKHILRPLRTQFRVFQRYLPQKIFATLLVLYSVDEAICVCEETTRNRGNIFNLLRGRCTLLPFPSALTSLCVPATKNVGNHSNCERSLPTKNRWRRSYIFRYFPRAHYNSGQPRYKRIPKVTTILTFTSILNQTLTANGEFLRSKLYANNTNDPGLVDPSRPFQQDCPPSLLETGNWNLTLV